MLGPTWKISPFIRPLVRKLDAQGLCAYPPEVEHCHGTEVHHADGTAECLQIGSTCAYPRPGMHAFIHTCDDVDYRLVHHCSRCR